MIKATFHRTVRGLVVRSAEGRRFGSSLSKIPTEERRRAAITAILKRVR